MSHKPIIIDGVNVSGCVYRAEEKCILKDDECCLFPNCDHKQLQRKEQECKELRQVKKDLPDMQMPYVILYRQIKEQYYKLEQECEMWKHQAELGSDTTDRLTKQLEEKEQDIDNCREELYLLHNQLDQLKVEKNEIKQYLGISSKTIMERLEELQEFRDEDTMKLFKYKQALQEIKELTEKNYCEEGVCGFQSRRKYSYCGKCIHKIILQKCEVLKDE